MKKISSRNKTSLLKCRPDLILFELTRREKIEMRKIDRRARNTTRNRRDLDSIGVRKLVCFTIFHLTKPIFIKLVHCISDSELINFFL